LVTHGFSPGGINPLRENERIKFSLRGRANCSEMPEMTLIEEISPKHYIVYV
jgi:hypothetical protein